jgi:hypothetical protein
MPRPRQAHGLRSKVYTPTLLAIFRKKFTPGAATVDFTLDELRQELEAAGLQARNLPDLIYRMKSRTALPDEIQTQGFRILEIVNRGSYRLVLGEATLIDYPEQDRIEVVEDRTPPAVRNLLGTDVGSLDEQGFLSIIRYNDLIARFLETRTFHLKAHVRKSVTGVGQVEVDDLHVALPGQDSKGSLAIVPVEAKAKDDPVNRVQIAQQIRFAKQWYPGLAIRPITVKLFEDGLILFMEFNPTTDPNELQILHYSHFQIAWSEAMRLRLTK